MGKQQVFFNSSPVYFSKNVFCPWFCMYSSEVVQNTHSFSPARWCSLSIPKSLKNLPKSALHRSNFYRFFVLTWFKYGQWPAVAIADDFCFDTEFFLILPTPSLCAWFHFSTLRNNEDNTDTPLGKTVLPGPHKPKKTASWMLHCL